MTNHRENLRAYLTLTSTMIVVSILIGVTVWDVCLITDGYMHDNAVTLVSWQTSELDYPYLNFSNFSAYFYLDDMWGAESGAAFPQAYHEMRRSFPQPFHVRFPEVLANLSIELEKIYARIIESNRTDLSLADRKVIFQSLDVIGRTDDTHERCIDELPLYPGITCDTEYFAYFAPFDGILRNAHILDALEMELWKKLIRGATDEEIIRSQLRYTASLVSFRSNEARMDFDLFHAFNPASVNEERTQLEFIFDLMVSDLTRNETDFPQLVLQLRNHEFEEVFKIFIRDSTELTIVISSQGILDRSATNEDCLDVPFVDFGQNLSRTLAHCQIVAIISNLNGKCGCIPFYQRRNFVKLDPSYAQYPLCDSGKYAECWQRHKSYDSTQFDGECQSLCRSAKNKYDVSQVIKENDQFYGGNIRLTFKCTELTYVMYTEKPQLTATQFVGQVGGDIGLYTGLSIFSVWQFLIVAHDMYQNSKERKRTEKDKSNGRHLWNSILTAFGVESDAAKEDDHSKFTENKRRVNTIFVKDAINSAQINGIMTDGRHLSLEKMEEALREDRKRLSNVENAIDNIRELLMTMNGKLASPSNGKGSSGTEVIMGLVVEEL